MDITGFTYEAEAHCWPCTKLRFGPPTDSVSPYLDVQDCEGNPVHPIFSSSEWDNGAYCGDCLEPIDTVVIDVCF